MQQHRSTQRRLMPRARQLYLLAVVCLSIGTAALAEPAKPPRPPGKPTIYQPDQQTCQVSTITAAYQRHLAPFADQPEAVKQKLRGMQADMTSRTIDGCLSQGLLSAGEAAQLRRKLGLHSGPTAPGR
ncbi:hypothetical protein H8F24_15650 [Synechococcus sp. CBW1002]|uniref:hypothetical protein n=1 Tax=Synechococcus sp. CBW1002 TaxID=1353134 RepID=UPI0018CD5800|nr:hypothetical protein [Synechococcus sp. CBW1002]QPN59437.1 hypothetical protein H8F24_15650 [Synechococcus sp. CBW1002]